MNSQINFQSNEERAESQTISHSAHLISDPCVLMKLPLEKRRLILAEQAEAILPYYLENQEWQELQTFDLLDD